MIFICPFMFNSANCNVTLDANTANIRCMRCLNTDHNDADAITYKIDIPAGTYTMFFFANTGPSSGIAKISIDGTVVATHDLYADPGVANNGFRTNDIVVSPGGLVDLVVYVDGKNASSSDHYMVFMFIQLNRTA